MEKNKEWRIGNLRRRNRVFTMLGTEKRGLIEGGAFLT